MCFNKRSVLQSLFDPAKLPVNSALFCLNRISSQGARKNELAYRNCETLRRAATAG